jgi:hypothetical protein
MTPKAKRDIYRAGKWLLPSIWAIGTFFSGLVVDEELIVSTLAMADATASS